MATDTVANLTSRLRGAETVAVEVLTSDGGDNWIAAVQQKLEQVAGVSRVIPKESKDGLAHFIVESMTGRHIRPDLARTVIEGGWQLNELHAIGLSLEEIFLQLTATPKEEVAANPEAAAFDALVAEETAASSSDGRKAMKHIHHMP